MKHHWYLILIISLLTISCKKETPQPDALNNTTESNQTAPRDTCRIPDRDNPQYGSPDTIFEDVEPDYVKELEDSTFEQPVLEQPPTSVDSTKPTRPPRVIQTLTPSQVMQATEGDPQALKEFYGLVFPAVEDPENQALLAELQSHFKFIWGRIKENDPKAISLVLDDMNVLKDKLKNAAPENYVKERGGMKLAEYKKLRAEMYTQIDAFASWYKSAKNFDQLNDKFQTLLKAKRSVERFRPGLLVINPDGSYTWIHDPTKPPPK